MLFSSIPFIFYFLFAFFVIYFAVPKKFKNFVLMTASLVFYGCGEPVYLILMSASIMIGYGSGLLMGKYKSASAKKTILAVSTVILAGFLAYFKYADFFIENFAAITGLDIAVLGIALPIGISFYTFQILSYTIDVYRGAAAVKYNIVSFAAYVTMFPQLIAGPIVRYTDVAKELDTRTHSFSLAYEGVRRFIIGLSKKILIANSLAEFVDIFKASDEKSVLFYWMSAVCYAMFVYFDFSGYSDMAIGLGKIMGFKFPENFNYPFISKSVTEFWRRWHMTLGGWFRDYIYIPLGGNRVKFARWIFNIAVVWSLTGLWHGAAWNFVIWGVMFAVLLVLEKLFLAKVWQKLPKIISHAFVLFIIMISFIVFDSPSVAEAFDRIGGLFGLSGVPLITNDTIYYVKSFAITVILAVVGSTPLVKMFFEKLKTYRIGFIINTFEPAVMAFLLILCTAYLVDGSFNPFLYFRF